ncbi:hypothetical protein, partial [Vibrio harveyi]|uniref:hypothetical protein n=1 Tax=Vibrio harveyi TaxID=669 RepID=UPI001E50B904
SHLNRALYHRGNMSERSLELLKQSVDNKIKYDYFIVGISAATFSYFAKDFTALPNVGFNESSSILLSLLLLSVSVISGLIKIERNNKGLEKTAGC